MPVILLTGEIGVGKTTLCERVIALSRRWEHRVGGVLTPALLDDTGQKVGIELVNLADGERRLLARVGDDVGRGMAAGRYSFAPAVLRWGNDLLARYTPEDMLWVVDEIGWLELERGQGFSAALEKLARPPRHTLVTVRQSLIANVRRRVAPLSTTTFFVTRENRDTLAPLVVRRLWGSQDTDFADSRG